MAVSRVFQSWVSEWLLRGCYGVSRVFLELGFRVVVKGLLWRSLGCF